MAVTTDVTEFESALAQGAHGADTALRARFLTQAVQLYRGDLLSGYYEDWIFPERERLAQAHLLALSELAALWEQLNDIPRAIDCAHRAVAADPLREESHRVLMRLLAAAHQPSAALRQYRELERLFREELDDVPSPATRTLARQIEESSLNPSPRPG